MPMGRLRDRCLETGVTVLPVELQRLFGEEDAPALRADRFDLVVFNVRHDAHRRGGRGNGRFPPRGPDYVPAGFPRAIARERASRAATMISMNPTMSRNGKMIRTIPILNRDVLYRVPSRQSPSQMPIRPTT